MRLGGQQRKIRELGVRIQFQLVVPSFIEVKLLVLGHEKGRTFDLILLLSGLRKHESGREREQRRMRSFSLIAFNPFNKFLKYLYFGGLKKSTVLKTT